MKNKKFYILTGIIFLILILVQVNRSNAQEFHYDRFSEYEHVIESRLDSLGVNFHTSIKPYSTIEMKKYENTDEIFYDSAFKTTFKLGKKNFISYDPLLNFEAGKDMLSRDSYIESGLGVSVKAGFFKKVAFGGSIMFNQSQFPDYVTEYIQKWRVIPGQGYGNVSSLGGYNYWNYNFYLNYHFLKYFTIEAGFGKNFFGDGYRSFLLSDNSFNYPYIKIETNVWNIKFTNIFANFKDMTNISSHKWGKMNNKFATIQYLDWNIGKYVSVGLFESIVWESKDTAGYRGFDINYLNPVIFYRPVEFSVGSPDNSLMGINLKVKVSKRSLLYGQLMLDDIMVGEIKNGFINRIKKLLHPNDSSLKWGWWTNKQAWQLGFKAYSLFGLKNLDLQIECNFARPYTFAHRRVSENYGNYNEPLAHPTGANFREACFFMNYNYKKWFFELHLNTMVVGYDTCATTNYGQNIYMSVYDTYDPEQNNIVVKQYGNVIAQGVKTSINYISFQVSYLIFPNSNLRAIAGIQYHDKKSLVKVERNCYIYLGIKTSIFKRLYDYF